MSHHHKHITSKDARTNALNALTHRDGKGGREEEEEDRWTSRWGNGRRRKEGHKEYGTQYSCHTHATPDGDVSTTQQANGPTPTMHCPLMPGHHHSHWHVLVHHAHTSDMQSASTITMASATDSSPPFKSANIC